MSTTTPTFEEMMALFRETGRQIDEMRQAQAEADKRYKKEQKAWNKRFAEFSDRLGELIETMVRGGIVQLFRDLGYTFTQITRRGFSFRDNTIGVHGEVDLFLENGDYALLVEAKLKLSIDDVKDHMERVKKFRLYSDARHDKRRLIAAVGGGVIPDNVRDYALKHGLFVVQQSGKNIEVIPPEGDPKVW